MRDSIANMALCKHGSSRLWDTSCREMAIVQWCVKRDDVMLWSIVGWPVKRGGGIVETESCDGLSREMTVLWRQCHDRWFVKRDGSVMEMVLCNGSSREMVTLWKVLCDGSLKSWR
jgi:hypothetical protein